MVERGLGRLFHLVGGGRESHAIFHIRFQLPQPSRFSGIIYAGQGVEGGHGGLAGRHIKAIEFDFENFNARPVIEYPVVDINIFGDVGGPGCRGAAVLGPVPGLRGGIKDCGVCWICMAGIPAGLLVFVPAGAGRRLGCGVGVIGVRLVQQAAGQDDISGHIIIAIDPVWKGLHGPADAQGQFIGNNPTHLRQGHLLDKTPVQAAARFHLDLIVDIVVFPACEDLFLDIELGGSDPVQELACGGKRGDRVRSGGKVNINADIFGSSRINGKIVGLGIGSSTEGRLRCQFLKLIDRIADSINGEVVFIPFRAVKIAAIGGCIVVCLIRTLFCRIDIGKVIHTARVVDHDKKVRVHAAGQKRRQPDPVLTDSGEADTCSKDEKHERQT